jgi:hypothetical protein
MQLFVLQKLRLVTNQVITVHKTKWCYPVEGLYDGMAVALHARLQIDTHPSAIF